MEKVKMNQDGIFWVNMWRTVGAVLVSLALIIGIYNHFDGIRYTEMWNNCVNAGGQPIRQPMLGTESTTFTCLRP